MKIFLDSTLPSDYEPYIPVRTIAECKTLIDNNDIDGISYAYILLDGTGDEIASYIAAKCQANSLPCPAWRIHSADAAGRQAIATIMEAIQ